MKEPGDIDRAALLRSFVAEATENLAAFEEGLLAFEARPDDGEALNAAFRAAHTLKGNAGIVGLSTLGELTHEIESVLDRLRSGKDRADSALVTALLATTDTLRQLVARAAAGGAEVDLSCGACLRGALGFRSLRQGTLGAAPASPAVAPVKEGAGLPELHRTLRIEVERLDRMLDLVGQITVGQGALRQAVQVHGGAGREPLGDAERVVDGLHAELRALVMEMRHVPLGPTFGLLHRAARDAAAALGKAVRLRTEGAEIELDTAIVERLRDPLGHMIRNAVAHGIERPAERRGRGKDEQGLVTIAVRREAASVVIELTDDGAGLPRAALVERARALGIAESDVLPERDLHRLIFAPGFSTAPAVTELSGRGVGLDVVRRNIETIRGSIEVASREGEGTTFTIRLPLTMAIVDGFHVGVGSETYVIPLDSVVECMELPASDTPHAGEHDILNRRGDPLPYVRLRELFALPGAAESEDVVVVRHETGEAGLVVDALLGEGQVVVKPLGKLFQGLPGIAGSAVLGSGRVALILDVPAIFHRARRLGVGPRVTQGGPS